MVEATTSLHTDGAPSVVQPQAAQCSPKQGGRRDAASFLTRRNTIEEDLVAASRERHIGQLANHHLAESGAAGARVDHDVLDVA